MAHFASSSAGLSFRTAISTTAGASPLAKIFEARNAFALRLVEDSAHAARSLWQIDVTAQHEVGMVLVGFGSEEENKPGAQVIAPRAFAWRASRVVTPACRYVALEYKDRKPGNSNQN